VTEFASSDNLLMIIPDRQRVGSFVSRVARVSLGSVLLLATLMAHIPASTGGRSLCNLACCAGKAPHEAGSCAGDSCDAFRADEADRSHYNHIQRFEKTEQLCGLKLLIEKVSRARFTEIGTESTRHADHSQRSNSDSRELSVSSHVMSRPCQSECGSCASSQARSNKQRTAPLAFADRPRPPTSSRLDRIAFRRARELTAIYRRDAARGPPSSFS
jgi:hypothetical protein